MAVFKEVALKWGERTYTIPPEQVMRAIAVAEDVLTLQDLGKMRLSGNLKFTRLAEAWAAVLRFAGAEVSDEEVYDGMFRDKGSKLIREAWNAVFMLESLMIPPERLMEAAKEGKAAGGKRAASSSKRSSS